MENRMSSPVAGGDAHPYRLDPLVARTDDPIIEMHAVERRALGLLLAGDHPIMECLRRQLAQAHFTTRERTEHGFVARFHVEPGADGVNEDRELRIDDVRGCVSGVDVRFALYVRHGFLCRLEALTDGYAWPSRIGEWELAYIEREPGPVHVRWIVRL
jgi:hypothetical protein